MRSTQKQADLENNTAIPVQSRAWNVRLAQSISHFLARYSFRGAGAVSLSAGRILIKAPVGPTIVQTAYGTQMVIDPLADNHFYGIEPSLYYTGAYEPGTLEVMRSVLRQQDCYIDAGANIGTMSLWAAKLVGATGQVYCFEPEPTIYALLARNIALNGMPQVHAFNCALGSTPGTATIYKAPEQNRGSATLSHEEIPSGGTEVEVVTLDSIMAKEKIGKVRMLKVDVEGWELEVLRGAATLLGSAEAPILCVEYSSETHDRRHEDATDVYEWIRSVNDYQVFKLKKGKQNISQLVQVQSSADLPKHDNLFCFLPGHMPLLNPALFAVQKHV